MATSNIVKSCLVSICLAISSLGYGSECATSKCYVDAYSSVERYQFPLIDRVNLIYKKLVRTMGSKKTSRSKLTVIDSEGSPWAVALSDNSIVITKGAIQLMYLEDDLELGDARAAFVLGHELSHLSTEDLFHHRAFVNNQHSPGKSISLQKSNADEEMRADLRGYAFATIAGYRTDRLISGKHDFFHHWLAQIGNAQSETHFDNETRRQYLEDGFNEILQDVPYYYFAVALAHFGHYADAQILFEDYLNRVETMEAYSNLGYVHLQLAREKMPIGLAYEYWIPTLLEPNSGLKITRDRALFTKQMPEQAILHLQKAERWLKHAIDLDEDQLTSYINLAAVYLYMPGKLHRAYAAITDAKQTPLGKTVGVASQLESIYQLIHVKENEDDPYRWAKASEKMAELSRLQSTPDNLLFNYARILDRRGLDDKAIQYWQRLHRRLNSLPKAYQAQVCFRLIKNVCGASNSKQSPWVPDDLPLGQDIRYPLVKNYLKQNWNRGSNAPKALAGLQAQVFMNNQGDRLLALDNHIGMIIVRNIDPKYRTMANLQNKFGNPQVSLPVSGGQLYSFGDGWSALVQNEKVTEIWVADLSNSR